MDSRDFQILLDLYESRNITKVAQKHFISQPAMTKRLRKIEEDLGSELLLRSSRGVIFTPIGEAVIPYCRAMLQQNHAMRSAVNQLHGVIGGSINICASPNYGRYALPTVLGLYSQRYPQVELHVTTEKSNDMAKKLQKNNEIVAIRRGEPTYWDGKALLLAEEPMCLVRSNENTNRPLQEYSYIKHSIDADVAAGIDRWAAENGLYLSRGRMFVNDVCCCMELTQRGIGWSILPRICLDDFVGEIYEIHFADGTPFTRRTYALFDEAYAQMPQVKLFLETLQEVEAQRHGNRLCFHT